MLKIKATNAGPGHHIVSVIDESDPDTQLYARSVRWSPDEPPTSPTAKLRIDGAYRDAESWKARNGGLVGLVEIAQWLGVQRQTVDNWRTRRVLPTPSQVISGTPVWTRGRIREWAERTGRL